MILPSSFAQSDQNSGWCKVPGSEELWEMPMSEGLWEVSVSEELGTLLYTSLYTSLTILTLVALSLRRNAQCDCVWKSLGRLV